ncbi:uncharacterized protein F4807DRAFT_427703, partial [Annulohypoxylon truncatum]|uniref:uncharacterized protein n=1 Tax=Annulohypoxylon truncatum TaxID=327061 RepID=UPI0020075D17
MMAFTRKIERKEPADNVGSIGGNSGPTPMRCCQEKFLGFPVVFPTGIPRMSQTCNPIELVGNSSG